MLEVPCRQRRLLKAVVEKHRMLKQRVITALILLALLAAVLFALPVWAGWIAFALLATVAAWEWGGFLQFSSVARQALAVVMLLFCGVITLLGPVAMQWLLGLSAGLWLLIVPLWLRARWSLLAQPVLGAVVGMLLIGSTWAAMGLLHERSPWLLLGTMAVVWVADVAAYFSGRSFGKHKLAPSISPGKTWEGVAGAVVGVQLYGIILLSVTPAAGLWNYGSLVAAAVLVVLTGLSVIGDLFESLLKRQAVLKDSSQLLPGHGGVLDRIDALTSTLPLVAFLLTLTT
jgi:phosphatidate cytidylyltransferase